APTFLSLASIEKPGRMTGVDQTATWSGKTEKSRDHIICENRHEPTSVHLKTYVNKRYKITLYYKQEYGELFDLANDPQEFENLWDNPEYKELKSQLLLEYAWAELGKEPMWMPRISHA
ncbi:DUF4976 domain-containing protein, partial [Virgibacillus halodenitrificans]|nr:DUF4976 domain-containing protein [Virgibacillus halodenitrificans]